MNADIRRHILTLTLGGALAVLGTPALHAQTTIATPGPTATAPDTIADQRADIAGDRLKAETLHQDITADKAQLKSDMSKYGKNSPQVKADMQAIKSARNQEKVLNQQIKSTRQQVSALRAHDAQTAPTSRMGGRR